MNINLFYISNNKSNSDHENKLLSRLRSPIKVSLIRIPVKKKFKSKLELIEHEAKLLRAKIDFSKLTVSWKYSILSVRVRNIRVYKRVSGDLNVKYIRVF